MKPPYCAAHCAAVYVAPSVGAWIETFLFDKTDRLLVSLPPWERGLKQHDFRFLWFINVSLPPWERGLKPLKVRRELLCHRVAPSVGAWIETYWSPDLGAPCHVAPSVGAWIETLTARLIFVCDSSLPPWERGLKHPSPLLKMRRAAGRSLRGSVD